MSKQGVQLTQEHLKPRRRVQLEERNGVVGKVCTKCDEWKPLVEYSRDKKNSSGFVARCKSCINKTGDRRNKVITVRNGVTGKCCTRCNEWKSLDDYFTDKRKSDGRVSRCKDCAKEYYMYYQRSNKVYYTKMNKKWHEEHPNYTIEYYELNKGKISERMSKYQRENKGKCRMTVQRYKAFKIKLPNNLHVANSDYSVCQLTDSADVHLDHAIPISIGHGGTTYGNIYALKSNLNISKKDRNMFEWFDANRQRFELSQSRFDALIGYLASANALTVEEYRDFVYWCHANPRTVDEIKADQRHSIEIWREASGQQFPLPAYTETYNSADSNESEAI